MLHRFRLTCLATAIALLVGCATAPPPKGPSEPECPPDSQIKPTVRYEPAEWSRVEGWSADRPNEAWAAFTSSCPSLSKRAEWSAVCASARAAGNLDPAGARRFFEQRFTAYSLVQDKGCRGTLDTGLITAYYEPVLRGARTRSPQFPVPLYAPPDDLLTIDLGELYPDLKGRRLRGRVVGKKVVPYSSRAALASDPALRGKELVWVDDEVDAFFLQIQGSGRVQLPNGETVRIGYADQNGHPYRAIGRYLADQGLLPLDQTSAPKIRQWLQANPGRAQEVLNANPSFVFFREEKLTDPSQGPKGAMGIPLTPGRSIAVDPKFITLGAPVFLSTTDPTTNAPLQRLVVAQDTGGAINGIVRADLFWGMGPVAGENAGRMKQQGRMWMLWPKESTPGGAGAAIASSSAR